MRSWETGSEHLPPPVKQIVSQCSGISEHLGGKLLDPTSCGRTKGMSVHGHVREERIADRSSDLTDQQTFGGIDVRDLTDDAARQVESQGSRHASRAGQRDSTRRAMYD